jgi:tetratricopeptide (TPR) repeat protein
LRYGDAKRAAEKVDGSSARRIADPDFYAVLARTADKDDAPAWRALFAALSSETEGHVGGELGIDKDLLDAAELGIALEAYRRDPTHLPTAVELSRSLASFGLSEAVPLVIEGALKEQAAKGDIAASLEVLGDAIDADADAGDLAAARRTIDASAGVLAVAHRAGGAAEASAADLEYRMASVLVRGGFLAQARTLLVSATRTSPRASGYFVLALIERNAKEPALALEHLEAATKIAGIDPLDVADAKLVAFEIQRDGGKTAEAEKALADALASVSHALGSGPNGPYRVRGLRMLGRVLSAYGDGDGASKAFARALDTVTDRALVGATMLEAVSAALVRKDVGAARMSLKKGREAGADHEDLVYGALWLWLVERELGAKPDGSASEILGDAAGQSSWIGKLATWASGRMTDESLLEEANSEATRVEAAFYVAMAKRARGAGDDGSLRRVAESPVLDLLEVQIARELTAPRVSLAPPKGVKIP